MSQPGPQTKCLIGTKGWLFLINDSNASLLNHIRQNRSNNEHSRQKTLDVLHLTALDSCICVVPDKEVICAQFLPDGYTVSFRTGVDALQEQIRRDNLYFVDCAGILEPCDYYKTDTHPNLKGTYKIYSTMLRKMGFAAAERSMTARHNVELASLGKGLGVLTWPTNCTQPLSQEQKLDTYYSLDQEDDFYCTHRIDSSSPCTQLLRPFPPFGVESSCHGQTVEWTHLSSFLIRNRSSLGANSRVPGRTLFFYDSTLISVLPCVLTDFQEVLLCKSPVHHNFFDLCGFFKPDRVIYWVCERFV